MIDDWTFFIRVLIAMIVGTVIGFERQFRNRHAGIRTFAIICMASSISTMIGLYVISKFNQYDMAYYLLGVIIGMGFLGSGLIYKEFVSGTNVVYGLTSASVLLITAVLGVLIGLGMYIRTLISVGMVIICLWIFRDLELRFGLKKLYYKKQERNNQSN